MKFSSLEKWWTFRKQLDQSRGTVLMVLSFLIPLLIWLIACYGPWWKTAYQVTISAESEGLQSVFTPGDVLTPESWTQFQEQIVIDNAKIIAARQSKTPLVSSERQNKKIVRMIFPLALTNGWLTRDQEIDDQALRETLLAYAAGKLDDRKEAFSDENKTIAKENAAMLAKAAPEWPQESLLKFLPQAQMEVARPVYLVTPSAVASSFWKGITSTKTVESESGAPSKSLLQRYGESWRTIVLGFLLATGVAIPLGIMAGSYDFVSKLAEPFVNFFSYMPAPAFGVVLMAIFGLDSGPKIMLVFLGTLPPAILTIAKTTRSLDISLIEAAQTLGANQRQLIFSVVVPGILPSLFKDLRLLFGTAWTWLVIAELLGFKSGLSEVIDTHGRRFQFEIVYPAILMIGLSGFFMDQILAYLARYLFPWAEPARKGLIGKLLSSIAKKWVNCQSRRTPQPELSES